MAELKIGAKHDSLGNIIHMSYHGQEICPAGSMNYELYNSTTMCFQGILFQEKELDFHLSSFMAVIISDNILDNIFFPKLQLLFPSSDCFLVFMV